MSAVTLHQALLLGGWAVHFVFVSYVVAGTGVVLLGALRRGDGEPGPLERVAADWLPAALSGAITAAVVPLLFVQTLHAEAFYTAMILLFWRSLPLLPALVGGFYLLYVAKAREVPRVRATAAAGSLLCWLFAAFTWTSVHVLSTRSGDWTTAYASGGLLWSAPGLAARVVAWLGLMVPVGLPVLLLQTRGRAPLPTMALAAWVGAAVAAAAGALHLEQAATWQTDGLGLIAAGLAVSALAWVPALRTRAGWALSAAVALPGAALAVAGAAVVRESVPRADTFTERPAAVAEAEGLVVFVIATVLVTAAIVWVVRTVARDLRGETVTG